MSEEAQPVRPEDDPDVDQEALAAHRAEAEAHQEEVGTPEAQETEGNEIKFLISIKDLDPEGAVPVARQIEKWIDDGLSRHGNSGVVTAEEK